MKNFRIIEINNLSKMYEFKILYDTRAIKQFS